MQHREPEGPSKYRWWATSTDNEVDLTDKLLGVEPGGECTLYIDSPGGSPSAPSR